MNGLMIFILFFQRNQWEFGPQRIQFIPPSCQFPDTRCRNCG